MNSTTVIVTCGATAADIRSELRANASMRKVRPRETVGNYGDYVFQMSEDNAILMQQKYPAVVRII
jgi:hypothetical protein